MLRHLRQPYHLLGGVGSVKWELDLLLTSTSCMLEVINPTTSTPQEHSMDLKNLAASYIAFSNAGKDGVASALLEAIKAEGLFSEFCAAVTAQL